MNTKKFLIASIISASATIACAQINPIVSDIAQYVYPGNRTATPRQMVFAADGNGYLQLSADNRTIDRFDIATGNKIETVFDVGHTRETTLKNVEGFSMSDNGRYLLVHTESENVYRRSFTAKYYVYEVRTRLLRPLSYKFERQQAPLISPDGRMIAFVAENNIYIKKLDYDSEVAVTDDGEKNKIINGVPDWVYEEEFATNQSMTWAPDNLTLCYIKYNEEQVPLYSLPLYQGTCDPMDQYKYYPGTYTYKYPVAGEKNSKVSVHAYDVENRKIEDIVLPDAKIEYVPRISYGGSSPERLIVATMNRDQNHFELYSINPKSTVAKSIYTEDSKAWIDPSAYENMVFAEDGFIVLSTRTGYNHLYKYSYAGAKISAVTSGEYDVTANYGQDAKGNFYYQAALPTPIDRTVYKVDAKGKVSALSKATGTASAQFSTDKAYALMQQSDINTPPVFTISNSDGKQIRVVEDNAEAASKYASTPKAKFFTMQSDGNQLNGFVIMPENASGKSPVIMYQYSGPGSQQVLNKWGIDWYNYAAKLGFAVVCVDGRGTGGRGREFETCVYKRLGYYETIDQLNAAKWVAQQPWADPKRIGMHGWSYGGYETLMCASADNNPFAAAVAIAPVTNWRFYDTIYTERYMLTPQQNEEGYRTGSPLFMTHKLSCPLLIMYGTCDDNVHPQNSIQYVSMLQSQGGFCDMMIFPNMNHSIYGCNARAVAYGKMLDYFKHQLK